MSKFKVGDRVKALHPLADAHGKSLLTTILTVTESLPRGRFRCPKCTGYGYHVDGHWGLAPQPSDEGIDPELVKIVEDANKLVISPELQQLADTAVSYIQNEVHQGQLIFAARQYADSVDEGDYRLKFVVKALESTERDDARSRARRILEVLDSL